MQLYAKLKLVERMAVFYSFANAFHVCLTKNDIWIPITTSVFRMLQCYTFSSLWQTTVYP